MYCQQNLSKQHNGVTECSLESNASSRIRTSRCVLPNVDRNQIPILIESIVDVMGIHLFWNVQQVDRTGLP